MKTYDKYTYFWNGPFSQWAKSFFFIEDITFSTAEQYMMYKKALLFNDNAIATLILNTDDPREQKALGRKVKGFNVNTWETVARDIVFHGSMAKYTQNNDYYECLMKTTGTLLVEASAYDAIWGIGMDETAAKLVTPNEWKGSNWLGKCLTEVREALE